MAQDIRKLFELERAKSEKIHRLKKGHEKRFLERLDSEMPGPRKSSFPWFKIAASVAVLLAVVALYFNRGTKDIEGKSPIAPTEASESAASISLGDLSPDLRKVENYYVANINLALAELDVSQENKEMTAGFMKQLNRLNSEYERLNIELNAVGPNDQTITALIKNLQLRLQLLQKLQTKLNELKTSKNEHVKTI